MRVTARRVVQDRMDSHVRDGFIYGRITKGPHTGLQRSVKLELSGADLTGMSPGLPASWPRGLVVVRMSWSIQYSPVQEGLRGMRSFPRDSSRPIEAHRGSSRLIEAHRWEHCRHIQASRDSFLNHDCRTGRPTSGWVSASPIANGLSRMHLRTGNGNGNGNSGMRRRSSRFPLTSS